MRLALTVCAAFIGSCMAANAQTASADPAFIAADGQSQAPYLVASVALAGTPLSVVATGRAAAVDTQSDRERIYEAMDMGKVLPGYPQPAQMTLGFQVSF
jgi:hypothetical protein